MNRHYGRKILSGFLIFSFIMSFSFAVLADPFTGAYLYTGTDPVTGDPIVEVRGVNPSGQTFSGQNVIEMNAYNNAPILTNNTFNGSTDINPDFTDITSNANTYNGSVDIDYSGLGGTLESNGDVFQSTTLTAQQSDVSFNNGTFNGNTTINAASVSLGSVSQMDSLLNLVYTMYVQFMENYYHSTSQSYNKTNPYTNNSVTIDLNRIYRNYYTYSNGALSLYREGIFGTYNAGIKFAFEDLGLTIKSIGDLLIDKLNRQYTYMVGTNTYSMYTFTTSGETYSLTKANQSVSFRDFFINRIDTVIEILNWHAHHFFEWYYPLDNTLPEYWRYYNTDTADDEEIGLAGLMYNISWYLGQMYVLQSESAALDNFTDQVEAVTDTLEEAESKENQIISSISSGINSFAPDLTSIGSFRALSWASNYLQQMYVALGTYGTVILIGLLLGVCMQFIGYFKFK